MQLVQIGIIHSPFKEPPGTPIQPAYGSDSVGTVEVFPQFAEGLSDIEGFGRIWLIYGAHLARPFRLKITPFRDTVERGVFATRAPSRPNSILISAVRLVGRRENILDVAELDILDGSPLFDIKPYSPKFDCFPNSKSGWLDSRDADITHADDRF
jgi:tRNA-Thr(GGU) m(6)t(6)A37 methyltransferase TsaA